MLKLGRAQGVTMAAGLSRQIPITEYSPKKIKMSITGNGNATKEQVAKMLPKASLIKEIPKNLDATDGLAAAVCHFYNQGRPDNSKTYSGWKTFISQNPKNKVGLMAYTFIILSVAKPVIIVISIFLPKQNIHKKCSRL